MGDPVINSRRTHKLTDDNTFRTIDHESTCLRHQREISHEDLMFVYLISFLIIKPDPDFQGSRIGRVTLFALVDRVLHVVFTKRKINEFQTQVTAVISDR